MNNSQGEMATYVDDICRTVREMLLSGFMPLVIIGAGKGGSCQARPISRHVTADMVRTLVARVMVGEIDPTLVP